MLSGAMQKGGLRKCCDFWENAKNMFLPTNGPNLLKMVPDFTVLQGFTKSHNFCFIMYLIQ